MNCVFAKRIELPALACIIASSGLNAQIFAQERSYLYLGDYPQNANTGWHENAQGLAHDDDHWFITQTEKIWKIPVERDLSLPAHGAPGVIERSLGDYPALSNYNHVGDPVHFEFEGVGYLVAPLEGDNADPAIAIFLGNNLTYVDHATLPLQQSFGWCAVAPNGDLYTSETNASAFFRYTIDWNRLRSSNELRITSGPTPVPIHDEYGAPLQLHWSQGGEFTPSGDLLYYVTGYYEDTDETAEGIHVFDTTTWQRVQHSTNGFGHFNFEFHTGCCTYEESEGLTIWDLDDGRAPGITGQLHVMLLDNDETDADEIFVKHYGHTIYVYADYMGPERGTPSQPFNTIGEASFFLWDGGRIRIRANSYPENLIISKRMLIESEGGIAIIGE